MRAMANFFDDVRFGLRMLRKNPGFATGAILTMTLGIGANTAVFSVVNAVLFRSLPGVSQPERLVSMSRIQNGAVYDNFSLPDYKDYRDRNRSFSGIAAHVPAAVGWNDSSPERLGADLVTDNYFAVLGVQPAAGRLLAADDRNGIVISYSLWRRKFGGADVVGKSVTLDGFPFIIVGVAHQDFRGTVVSFPFDVWATLENQTQLGHLSENIAENRSSGWLQLFGRLKAGVDLKQAGVEIKTIAAQLGQAYPLTNNKRSASIAGGVGIFPDDRAEVTGLLGLLAAAVAILLLIGCANVAGLLVIRAAGRSREIATRIAVGAGTGRIVRQLLTEGFILALIAGSLGVFCASWATEAVINLSQGSAPSIIRHAGAQVDGRVLAFTFAISVATGVLFALLPALQTLKVDLNRSLKSGSPGAGFSKARLRSVLVMGQVALSFALLSAAALLLGSLYKIVHANAGFDASHVALAPIDLSLEHYSESQGRQFYDDLLAKLSAAPDIEGASLATSVPPTEWPGTVSIFHPGEEPTPGVFQAQSFELGLRVNLDAVAPNYFHTLKIPMVAGRDFSKADRSGSPNVVIVSRRLAEMMWPHENAIGKRIAYPQWDGPRRAPFEVVGVAADVKHRSLAGEFPLILYVPLFIDGYNGRANIVVRTREDAAAGIAEIRQAARQLDSRLPVYFSQTGDQHTADSLWQQRMAAAWIGVFSLLALGLAAMGLYVVIAQSVAQRAREVGIRIALGATGANVVELIMKQALPLALAGIAAGIPAAIGFDGLMREKLEGIVGAPLPVFFGISVLLIIVMVGAIWIPARRATRIDPIQALRCD
jgi:predicted permease